MVMDVGRGPYARQCQFFNTPGAPTTEIQWYRAPEGAKFFPAPHAFPSLFWQDDPWEIRGVGEVYLSKAKVMPKYPTPPTATGQAFVGTIDQFQNGVPYDPLAVLVPRDPWGLIAACSGWPGGGNVAGGGDADGGGPVALCIGGDADGGDVEVGANCACWKRYHFDYTDFAVHDHTHTFDVALLDAGTVINAVIIKNSVQFLGGTIVDYIAQANMEGQGLIGSIIYLSSVPSDGNYADVQLDNSVNAARFISFSGTQHLQLVLNTASAAYLDEATQGEVDVWVLSGVLP